MRGTVRLRAAAVGRTGRRKRAAAISRAVRRFGTRRGANRMAQESGEHPQAPAERMHWVRQLAAAAAAPDLRARARLAGPRGSPPRPAMTQPGQAGRDERDM